MPIQPEVFQKVSAVLLAVLEVDKDEINLTSTLQGDLGADSIDFLDIVFRLEREFHISITRNELFPELIFQYNSEHVCNGKVTPEGINHLHTKFPWFDLFQFERNPNLANIDKLFTVEMLCKYIDYKLQKK